MAFVYRTNQTPLNHSYSMWQTVMTLIDAGWQCQAWSDGISETLNLSGSIYGQYGASDPVYSQASVFPAQGAALANGFGSNKAWIILRQPNGEYGIYGGRRQIIFQRGTSDANWRMKYSKSGNFKISTGTVLQTPAIDAELTNDEVHQFGGGSDAEPTFKQIFFSTNGSSRHNVVANNGGSGETAPFGFIAFGWNSGLGGVDCGQAILFDPMISGTTAPQDIDPYVFYSHLGTGQTAFLPNTYKGYTDVGESCNAWFRYGMAAPTGSFSPVAAAVYSVNVAGSSMVFSAPAADSIDPLGSNPHNGYDDLFPVVYIRPGSAGGITGYKGISSMVKWTSTARSVGDTFSLTTTRDKISLSSIAVQWDGTVPTV